MLARARTFLENVDTALARIVENAGSRRHSFSSLVDVVRSVDNDKVWHASAMSGDFTVEEFDFIVGGVDYICEAFNRDGRTLRLVDRVHGLILGARMRGLSARWVASLVDASDRILQEALSSFSLEPQPSGSSRATCSDSSESYKFDTATISSDVDTGSHTGIPTQALLTEDSA